MRETETGTAPRVQAVGLTPLEEVPGGAAAAPAERLAALAGVKARLTVVAGDVHTTVGELLSLKEGAVLPMATPLNAPFDLVLNGTVIARGELVAVAGHFGLRITQAQAGERP